MHMRRTNHSETEKQGSDGDDGAGAIAVGELAGKRGGEERDRCDRRKESRHGSMADVKFERNWLKEDSEAVGDTEGDEGANEAGEDHDPGARGIQSGFGLIGHSERNLRQVHPRGEEHRNSFEECYPMPLPICLKETKMACCESGGDKC